MAQQEVQFATRPLGKAFIYNGAEYKKIAPSQAEAISPKQGMPPKLTLTGNTIVIIKY